MNDCCSGCVAMLATTTAKGFESVTKHLNAQLKYNRKVAVFALSMLVCVGLMYKKIERLSDEVKELKQTMGE